MLVAAAILAAFLGMQFVEYVVWSKPGNPVIEGMQGRYLIPLALFVAAMIPALGWSPGAPLLARLAYVMLWTFPPITIAVTLFAVIHRYYI
jgi:hypothetical protein